MNINDWIAARNSIRQGMILKIKWMMKKEHTSRTIELEEYEVLSRHIKSTKKNKYYGYKNIKSITLGPKHPLYTVSMVIVTNTISEANALSILMGESDLASEGIYTLRAGHVDHITPHEYEEVMANVPAELLDGD